MAPTWALPGHAPLDLGQLKPALRIRRIGAGRLVGAWMAGIALCLVSAARLTAQEPPDTLPPPPDSAAVVDTLTVPLDSLQAAPDSAQAAPDSAQAAPDSAQTAPDSLQAGPDSLQAAPDSALAVPDTMSPPVVDLDTVPVPVMPGAPRGPALGWSNELWEWDRDELLATRAVELTELLALVPGVVPLRGGDYGMPRTATSLAAGPGRIRVFWDGFELPPLEGGVTDLARIPLSGLERVRVDRSGGELKVELWSLEQSDRRPYTLIETGTGDLDTNIFRGTFGHPRILGGKLHLSLDRLATGGTDREEPGSVVGFWLSYSLEPSERWGLRAEIKRMNSDRGSLYQPQKAARSDWVVRGRGTLWPGVVAEGFAGKSSIRESEADSLVAFTRAQRAQYGLRVGVDRAPFWGLAALRFQDGDGVPASVLDVRGGGSWEKLGGVEVGVMRERWSERSVSSKRVRAWTRSLFGLSAFASYQDGSRGVPFVVPPPVELPPDSLGNPVPVDPVDPASLERFTERTARRLGAQFDWRGVHLSAARLRVKADSLHPMGFPPDAGGLVLPGGERKGYEYSAVLPLWPRGMALRGVAQRWDDEPEWRYLPQQTWQGALDFRQTFLPSGNLEVMATLGIQGRDPMIVPLQDEGGEEGEGEEEDVPGTRMPWAQTLFARLQIRVMTFRIYVTADNLTLRTENQDFPDRFLPGQRVITGVRWTLWN